jgi:hypothetical protein
LREDDRNERRKITTTTMMMTKKRTKVTTVSKVRRRRWLKTKSVTDPYVLLVMATTTKILAMANPTQTQTMGRCEKLSDPT